MKRIKHAVFTKRAIQTKARIARFKFTRASGGL
jgi:hypothetical protein